MKKINSLTGGRFLAILVIVFSHFLFLEQYSYGKIYMSYLHNATLGTDYFFMLSGFGMMLSYLNKETSLISLKLIDLIKYALKHVKKIYPIYIITMIIGIPTYIYHYIYNWGGTLYNAIISCLIKFSLTLTLLQSLTGMTKYITIFNEVTWFLSTLFCIYIVSPLLLYFFKKYIKRIKSAFIILVLSIAISLFLAIIFGKIEELTIFDGLTYYSPFRRVLYVINGMLIGQIYYLRVKDLPLYAEYFSIIFSLIWFLFRNSVSGNLGVFVYAIDMTLCSFDLYVISLSNGFFSKILGCKVMVYFGNLSMYIFLTHWLLIWYLEKIVNYLNLQSPITGIIEIIVVCLLSFLISAMLYNEQKKIGKNREDKIA